MAMNDLIADMLTRIRNASQNRVDRVECKNSKICAGVARVLQDEGFIRSYEVVEDGKQGLIRIELKYGPQGEPVFEDLQRSSRPGKRVYCGVRELPRPLAGLGIGVVSTPQGVLSDRQARQQHVGGELLCTVG
jgi:small subunit ribosomal protein S8